MILTVYGNTDVGMQRDHNEDSYLILYEQNGKWLETNDFTVDLDKSRGVFCVVADGMGGANAGEVASSIAVQTVRDKLQKLTSLTDSVPEITKLLFSIIQEAHTRIIKAAHGNRNMQGMGTTIVIGCITKGKLFIAWCGDSRCYVYNKVQDKNLYPFTDDHSLVWERVKNNEITEEEARLGSDSNLILQSLGGSSQKPEPDYKWITLKKGDRLIFCSDGLNSMLSGIGIQQILDFNPNPKETCLSLIEAAKKAGGSDNITTIVVDIIDGPENVKQIDEEIALSGTNELPKINKSGKTWLYLILITFLVLILAAIICREKVMEFFQARFNKEKNAVVENLPADQSAPEIIVNSEEHSVTGNELESSIKKTQPGQNNSPIGVKTIQMDSAFIENSIRNSLEKIAFIKNTIEWYKPGGKIGSSPSFYEKIRLSIDSILLATENQESLIQSMTTTTSDYKLVRITDYVKANSSMKKLGDTLNILEKRIRLIFAESPPYPKNDSLTI